MARQWSGAWNWLGYGLARHGQQMTVYVGLSPLGWPYGTEGRLRFGGPRAAEERRDKDENNNERTRPYSS